MIIMRIGLSGPWTPDEKPVVESQAKEESEVPEAMVFNPEIAKPLPDLNQGYVFVEDRELDESDLDEFTSDGKKEPEIVSSTDLEEVFYEGSVIIGELRKALVAYPAAPANVEKGSRTRAPVKGRAASVLQHEQLDQGALFMGFVVARVEEDRIVFEKDGEKIEKFLHDQNKSRVVVRGRAGQPTRAAAAEASPVASPPAVTRAPEPPTEVTPRNTAPTPETGSGAPSKPPGPPADLLQRRSQRLLRLDPSMMAPPPPTAGSDFPHGRAVQ